MCQYLYASFSLKAGSQDGLTAEQAAAVARWREVLTGIAIEEMLHLALVFNVMTAIGAAPPLSRPNFPRKSERLARRRPVPSPAVRHRLAHAFPVPRTAGGHGAHGCGGIRADDPAARPHRGGGGPLPRPGLRCRGGALPR